MINNKNEAILVANQLLGKEYFKSSLLSYSKINKSKAVWWFNIRTERFSDNVDIFLNTGTIIIWLHLPVNFVGSVSEKFKIRQDKDAVDIEISADKSYMYMRDVKSGGTGFNFTPFVKREFIL